MCIVGSRDVDCVPKELTREDVASTSNRAAVEVKIQGIWHSYGGFSSRV